MKLTTFLFKASSVFLVSLMILCSCGDNGGEEDVTRNHSSTTAEINTDIEPIYNHFPSLPKTSEIQWQSNSAQGIGLTKVNLYIFAKYESSSEINLFLQENVLEEDLTEINPPFEPTFLSSNDAWRKVEGAHFAFQDGILNTRLMNTEVYINDDHTIIYIEAVGQ